MSSGILLIGHGTRDSVGTNEFFQFARCLSQQVSPVPVEPALLEFQEPTIDQAWQRLIALGVHHVHVAPLLLFAAGHAKQDIPDVVRACCERTPHVSWSQSRPLSRHPALVELAIERARATLARIQTGNAAAPDSMGYVVVGRGSHDPCAQADTRFLASVLAHRLRMSLSATAFYAMASPNVPSVLDQIAEQGRVNCILVQPHLLFAGRLYDAISKQVDEARTRHPEVEFLVTDYLGPHPLVAQAVASRVFGASNRLVTTF